MKKPKWDTEMGRLLWLEGKCDGEIADEFGIAISTVTSYRKRHWEKQFIRKEDRPAQEAPMPAPEDIKEEKLMPESSCAGTAGEQAPATMYDYMKLLQFFSEGLGRIRKANMDDISGCSGESTLIAFEGEIQSGQTFSIELIITNEEDSYV